MLALRIHNIHQILSGCNALGALQGKVKHMLGTDNTVSDSLIKQVVLEICVQKTVSNSNNAIQNDEPQKISLNLFPNQLEYFDPDEYHLTGKESEKAIESIRLRRKKELAALPNAVEGTVVFGNYLLNITYSSS